MRKLTLSVMAAMVSILLGCGPALQVGVGIIGNAMAKAAEETYKNPQSSPVTTRLGSLGKEIEAHNVGDYLVKVFDGSFKGRACIFFIAYQGTRSPYLYYEKKNPEDMKRISDFNGLDEAGKKRFIREQFLLVAKIDLGPVEVAKDEPPANELSDTKPLKTSPSYNIPTTGFAPRIQ